ncbi:SgcJ/EcaC family oxidoreductase [Pseudoalteromonas sp. MMG013]|uniref:SgcJ/EcaC family oxidoreductase n=1 Tax=Pseudoalteromonas sp. MMG013 TaxID=2822687 RepID=UPI001B39CCA3|nr:SgcJ/EcaC family oxidoreductase [Pseudoalteromonas sp. MMG013]MBQ4862660.1 SgcJ/EcaC family oxidoreductase [Pseudoalteromonas sp. MMG013]
MASELVLTLFEKWNHALQSGDPKRVTELYAHDAVLLPTISDLVRHNPQEFEDYFMLFLKNEPKAHLVESNVRTYTNIAIHSGIYHIQLNQNRQVQARFTFVYQKIKTQWLIVEHHSSQMPEQ